jgi:hypothetical protein
MSNENDREIKTEKITSNSNTPVEEYRSERSSSTVTTDNGSSGLIIGLVLALAAGLGATMYFLNNRPTVPIVVPGATNTIKENKSTVIERNNTNVKESAPSTPQPAPKVEVNVPRQPAPDVNINLPAPTAPTQPVTPDPVPAN